MGEIYTCGEICAVTGKVLDSRTLATVSCSHCRAVIRVFIVGTGNHENESPFKCKKCRKPICRHCGTTRPDECSPFLDQVERSIKSGKWEQMRDYQYKNYVFGMGSMIK